MMSTLKTHDAPGQRPRHSRKSRAPAARRGNGRGQAILNTAVDAILHVSEREQRRIGKALHDGLCQELAGIACLVKTMHHKLLAGEKVTEKAASDVAALLQEAVKHARALAGGLQPVGALPEGLAAALRNLAADTADLFSINCHFRCPRPLEIADPGRATHLYRIAQECVRDAIHSANARWIDISLLRRRGGVELSVSDDAARTSSANALGTEMVHEMIQHRARMAGGRIHIRPRRGGGVRVTCHVAGV